MVLAEVGLEYDRINISDSDSDYVFINLSNYLNRTEYRVADRLS